MLLPLPMVLARNFKCLHTVWLYVLVRMGHHMATVGVASMPAQQEQHHNKTAACWELGSATLLDKLRC